MEQCPEVLSNLHGLCGIITELPGELLWLIFYSEIHFLQTECVFSYFSSVTPCKCKIHHVTHTGLWPTTQHKE